jgi:hypothetical protein
LRIATQDPEYWTAFEDVEETADKARALASSARTWAKSFAPPSDDFQVSVTESLLLANAQEMEADFLSDASDRLIGRLKELKQPEEQVIAAYAAVLGRKPDAEEKALLVEYLTERKDRSLDAARQMVWSLLTGGEMRFNY